MRQVPGECHPVVVGFALIAASIEVFDIGPSATSRGRLGTSRLRHLRVEPVLQLATRLSTGGASEEHVGDLAPILRTTGNLRELAGPPSIAPSTPYAHFEIFIQTEHRL